MSFHKKGVLDPLNKIGKSINSYSGYTGKVLLNIYSNFFSFDVICFNYNLHKWSKPLFCPEIFAWIYNWREDKGILPVHDFDPLMTYE